MKENKLKILIAILALIAIVGAIIIGVKGLNVDLNYRKSIRMDIYIGKTFESEEIKQIATEVFETNEVIVQKVELFEDMAAITIPQDIEKVDEKIETLNTKLNEKYELKNKKEDITVTYQPKIKLLSIVKPYITPCVISGAIVLLYSVIRFRKLGIVKIILKYVICILGFEALYLSIYAILGAPVNTLTIGIGLILYVLVCTIVTVNQERSLEKLKLEEK